ncbi:MAG: hypothetical protein AAGC72_18050 [Planctomycetota bacterium]
MGNIKINPGGFIGALIALIGGIILLGMLVENADKLERGPATLAVLAVIGGALGGISFGRACFVTNSIQPRINRHKKTTINSLEGFHVKGE